MNIERFRLYCKHSYYRWAYGMNLSLRRRIAAWIWRRFYARPFPSVYRPNR